VLSDGLVRQKAIGSRNSTPSRASRSPELEDSPAPLVVNARVAALRDPASSSSRRVSTPSAPRSSSSGPYGELVRHGSAKKRQRETPYEGEGKETPSQPQRRRSSASARHVEPPSNHHISHSHIADSSMDPEESMRHHSRSSAPVTISGLPVLVEAASRRQSALAETDASREKVAAPRPGRLIAHEKTRSSSRLGLVAPFGMPLPPVVEYKSEVRRASCPDVKADEGSP